MISVLLKLLRLQGLQQVGINSPVVQKSFDVVRMSAFLTYYNIQVNIQFLDNMSFETKQG